MYALIGWLLVILSIILYANGAGILFPTIILVIGAVLFNEQRNKWSLKEPTNHFY